jgi:hypothetical protein
MARRPRQADKQHRWLTQVEVTGVILSEPVLAEAASTGFTQLEKSEIKKVRNAHQRWNLPKDMVEGNPTKDWIHFILEELLELDLGCWLVGADIQERHVANLPIHGETLRPGRILVDEDETLMLLLEVPRDQSLDKPWIVNEGGWKANPTTKMERLLRETKVEVGLVTNGEAWRLIIASPSETTAQLTWTAQTWLEALSTLDAFVELLGEARFYRAPKEQTLIELVKLSRERQLDVADKLGGQTREALAILVHELDRVDAELEGELLEGRAEEEIFEAAVAFIMRLLFMLYAEENRLLPHGSVAFDRAYGVLHLLTELEHRHRIDPDQLERSFEAYARVLSVCRLVHLGSPDADIHVHPHGGHLFDAEAYSLLEGRKRDGSFTGPLGGAPRVSDRAIRQILRSLKYARVERGAPQLVSYRSLDVEQIGYMYEGLLDREVARAPASDPVFLLRGKDRDSVTTILKSELDALDNEALAPELAERTGREKETVANALSRDEDDKLRLPDPGTKDPDLLGVVERIHPLLADQGAVRAGGFYVSTSEARGAQGAHYTPPSLTEPIVRHALEPLVYKCEEGKPGAYLEPRQVKGPDEILALNVCDPAVGSGAFLVQAVRHLADRLTEAWEAVIAENPEQLLTMPFAMPSRGGPDEALIPEEAEERTIAARRYVAEMCVYGVDMNPTATEMAKLSLWLVTLAVGKRFTFLDHALKVGNSLVGASLDQIRSWNLDGSDAGMPLLGGVIKKSVDEALAARQDLAKLSGTEEEKLKRTVLGKAEAAADDIRLLSDLLVGSFFGGSKKAERKRNLDHTLSLATSLSRKKVRDKALKETGELLDGQATFHWEVEFPEVFDRGGFDGIVGNPPFLWGKGISGHFGDDFRDWLFQMVANEVKGSADLAAFFLLRYFSMVKNEGQLGVIATNTIAQGDTREVGLAQLCTGGGEIFRATKSMPWPGAANLEISLLNIFKGEWKGKKLLHEREVSHINSFLDFGEELSKPNTLSTNVGLSYQGSIILGSGFLMSPEEAGEFVRNNPNNAKVLFPYINGKDLNSHPKQAASRWVINFFDWPLETAKQWPELIKIVERKVKSERDEKKRKQYREKWWQYAEKQTALYRAIDPLERMIACAQTSACWAPAFIEKGIIYSNTVILFPIDCWSAFAVMQSGFQENWKIYFGSTLETRARYTPSDCFETFPFPKSDPCEVIPELEDIGDRYHDHRRRLMLEREIGLTSTYNLFHDSGCEDEDIVQLRGLHHELDQRVADAYGLSDLELGHGWQQESDGKSRWGVPEDARREILRRLYELNQERHKEEVGDTGDEAA